MKQPYSENLTKALKQNIQNLLIILLGGDTLYMNGQTSYLCLPIKLDMLDKCLKV